MGFLRRGILNGLTLTEFRELLEAQVLDVSPDGAGAKSVDSAQLVAEPSDKVALAPEQS